MPAPILPFGETQTRKCNNETEPDGDLCPGFIEFGPFDEQAACGTCGGWEGRWAPQRDQMVSGVLGEFDFAEYARSRAEGRDTVESAARALIPGLRL